MKEERSHWLPIYVDYLESTIGVRENPNKLLKEMTVPFMQLRELNPLGLTH
jgi:hypothetical protein